LAHSAITSTSGQLLQAQGEAAAGELFVVDDDGAEGAHAASW
jgi:hypothetical protein